MENKQEKSQEDMVKEAVEEAKKSAAETESDFLWPEPYFRSVAAFAP